MVIKSQQQEKRDKEIQLDIVFGLVGIVFGLVGFFLLSSSGESSAHAATKEFSGECDLFCCADIELTTGWRCENDTASEALWRAGEAALFGDGLGAKSHGRSRCNIDIIDGTRMGWDEIQRKYHDKPVIIQGMFDRPENLTRRDELYRDYGGENLLVRHG
jgi:hypothetical protein